MKKVFGALAILGLVALGQGALADEVAPSQSAVSETATVDAQPVYMMNIVTQQVIRVDQAGNVTELSQADLNSLQTQFDEADQAVSTDTLALHRGGIGGGIHLGPIGGGVHVGRGGFGGGAHIGPIGGGIHIGRGGFWGGGRWHHHHWHHRHGRWAGDWAVIYA